MGFLSKIGRKHGIVAVFHVYHANFCQLFLPPRPNPCQLELDPYSGEHTAGCSKPSVGKLGVLVLRNWQKPHPHLSLVHHARNEVSTTDIIARLITFCEKSLHRCRSSYDCESRTGGKGTSGLARLLSPLKGRYLGRLRGCGCAPSSRPRRRTKEASTLCLALITIADKTSGNGARRLPWLRS